jgi:hypothetical protein
MCECVCIYICVYVLIHAHTKYIAATVMIIHACTQICKNTTVSVRNLLTTAAGTIHISADMDTVSLQPWLEGYAR